MVSAPQCRWFATLVTLCLAVALQGECRAQGGSYDVGDRVEVNRDNGWRPGTVVGGRGTRITVRLDDDGTLGDVPADLREKRLTRSYFASDLRPARGAAATPAPAPTRGPVVSNVPQPAVASASRRTWSDQTGRFSIDATYGGMNGDKVVLEKIDGSRIEVPLAKLSDADQQYVNSQGGDPDNPFAVASSMPAVGQLGGGGAGAAVRQSNKSGMRTIEPKVFSEWTFVPESKLPAASAPRRPQTVRLSALPNSKAFFEDIVSVTLSASGERAVVVRQEGDPGGDELVHLELVDLVAGKSLGCAALPEDVEVLDVDADTGQVAYKPDKFRGDDTQLTVAEIRGPQIVPMVMWEPHSDADWDPEKEVGSAKFVSQGRIVTSNFHSDALTVWKPMTAEATLSIPVSTGFRDDNLVLSPDGRYTALVMKAGIAIVDLIASEHVATLDLPERTLGAFDRLAFSADNTKLAALTRDGVIVWDLKTGETLGSFDHDTMFASEDIAWAGDFLFHRNQYLYDYRSRVLLWEFQGISMHDGASCARNGMLVAVAKDRSKGMPLLRTFSFPTREMLAKAEELRAAGSLVVARAGDPVAIELDIDENVISSDEVRRAVEANLQKAGYVVADKSDVVVQALCKQLPSQTVRIRDWHRPHWDPGEVQERTITPHPSSLTMSYRGQPVWRRSNMGQPGAVFHMQEGESLDAALQRLTTPNTKLLVESDFPKEIIRPGTASSNGAYGVTNLATGASGSGARFE